MHDSNIKSRIKALREAKGMTQEQLSVASGINRVSIARLETTDRGMTVYTAQKLAQALGCTINDLVEEQELNHDAR